MVTKHVEERAEPMFHPDSYGYHPKKSALDAVEGAHRSAAGSQPLAPYKNSIGAIATRGSGRVPLRGDAMCDRLSQYHFTLEGRSSKSHGTR